MTSTLWFWIVLLIVLLFLIWFIRRLIWRVIIICVVLFLLFLLWRWIHPSSANATWRWISNIPVNATNFVNHDLLNKDIVLPLYNPIESVKDTITDAVDIDILPDDVDIDIDVTDDKVVDSDEEEPRYSWFSKFFNSDNDGEKKSDDKKIDDLIDVEIDNSEVSTGSKQFVENRQQESVELKLSDNWEIIVETTTTGWEKIIDTVVKVWSDKGSSNDVEDVVKTWDTKTTKVEKTTEVEKSKKVEKQDAVTWSKTATSEKENDVVYIQSNPKKVETSTNKSTTTKTSSTTTETTSYKAVKGLTADEVREANEIFN